MTLDRNFDSGEAEALSAAVRSPDSPQDNRTTRSQRPPPPLSPAPDLMTLASLAKAKRIAHFAAQAASLKLPLANLDPLEALRASQPGTSAFTEFLQATLLLRSELAKLQQGLSLPLPGVLRNRRDRQGRLLNNVLGYVYHPWVYASDPFARFLDTYGPRQPLDGLLLGLNPGPRGMTQTGVPFADPTTAITHLGLTGQVNAPGGTHPGVPVTGFDSKKQEGSAAAVSALMCQRWGSVADYYQSRYVMNFCPLLMLDDDGKNITPADLRVTHPAMRPLRDLCDAYLACVVWLYQPKWVITLGNYTEKRMKHVLKRTGLSGIQTNGLLHPSRLARDHWSDVFPSWEAYADAYLPPVGAP